MNYSTIPKIIHYIWFGPKDDDCDYNQRWHRSQYDFEIVRWNNKNIKPYLDLAIEKFKGLDSLEKSPMVYVSDLVRLLILKDHGGVYIDHDFLLIKNLWPLLERKNLVLTFQFDPNLSYQPDFYGKGDDLETTIKKSKELSKVPYHSDNVNNCFIGVAKNHPLIDRAIELTVKNHLSDWNEKYPMSDWGVGPSVFTDLIKELNLDTTGHTVEQNGVVVYNRNFLHPVHAAEKYYYGHENYYNIIKKICDEKTAYAVHVHKNSGLKEFLTEKDKVIYFSEWYKETYDNC